MMYNESLGGPLFDKKERMLFGDWVGILVNSNMNPRFSSWEYQVRRFLQVVNMFTYVRTPDVVED